MTDIFSAALITLTAWRAVLPSLRIGEAAMRTAIVIAVITCLLVAFASTAHTGGLS